MKNVYDIAVQLGKKLHHLGYEIPNRTRAERLYKKYLNRQISEVNFDRLMEKRGAKCVLVSREVVDWKVIASGEPKKGDTFEVLAHEAAELVEGMGLNPPFEVEGGFDGADTNEGVVDNDCDRPCVGDQVRALNLVVRLAKLNREEVGL